MALLVVALASCAQLLEHDDDYVLVQGAGANVSTSTDAGGGPGNGGSAAQGGGGTGAGGAGGNGGGGNGTGGNGTGGTGGVGQVTFFEDFSSGDWPTANWLTEWLGPNSVVTVEGGEGRLHFGTADPAWARATSLQPALADAEVLLRFRFNHVGTEGNFRVWLRASGAFTASSQPADAYALTLTNSSGTMSIGRLEGGLYTPLASDMWSGAPDLAVHHLRFRVVGSQVSASVWRDGEAEPSTWELDVSDTNITGTGDLRLGYVKVSSARWVYVDDITLSSF